MKIVHLACGLLIFLSNINASSDIETAVENGKVSGQLRFFYLDRKFQGSAGDTTHRNSTAIGGHLKYETAEFNGFKLASALYTTNAIHVFDRNVSDPSLLGTYLENYSVLGEAYVSYDFKDFNTKTFAKLGYQRYDTPMVGSDDARMIANTFEAYKLVNKDVDHTTLEVAHVNAIAYGTYSNLFRNSGIISLTSGYPSLDFQTGKYYNLGKITTGKNTAGLTNLNIKYDYNDLKLILSDDYAWDLYNTLYGEVKFSWKCLLNSDVKPFINIQSIKQNSIGSEYMKYSALGGSGKIDSTFWASRVGVKYNGLSVSLAHSETSKNSANDDVYKHAIVTQFGGMPTYTHAMVSRHQFLAGVKANKYVGTYSFKNLGANLSMTAYFSTYEIDENSGDGLARTATEAGYDIKYYPKSIKNLYLRARGNFSRKFSSSADGDKGWDEYRFIANYTF